MNLSPALPLLFTLQGFMLCSTLIYYAATKQIIIDYDLMAGSHFQASLIISHLQNMPRCMQMDTTENNLSLYIR